MRATNNITFRPFLVILPLFLCTITFGKIIYVDNDAPVSSVKDRNGGLNDGSNWENAYVYLQDALADANESVKHALSLSNGPVEIRVAQGIYKSDQGVNQIPGDRKATFCLTNNVTLKGGYAGIGEPDPDARNVELYKTILNGDLVDNDEPIDDPHWINEDPSRADNSLCVVTATMMDPNTEINGLVITGACDYHPEKPDYICAGLYIGRDSKITISNCTFAYNAASGIVCNWSEPNVIDCTFENNVRISRGGGMDIEYNSSPRIIRCTFKDNWAYDGGGLFSMQSKLWLEDCIFKRNVACGLRCADTGGGGGVFIRGSLAGSKIKDCVFNENVASSGGGARIGIGLFPPTPSPRNEERVVLSGCTFINNQASSGGAISQRLSTLDIKFCKFHQNQAVKGNGGAISTIDSFTNLSHCIFTGNSSFRTGASIISRGSQVRIWDDWLITEFFLTMNNCTFRGNFSPIGRTLYCGSNGTEHLDNTIISNCIIDNEGNEIYNPDGSTMTISYTNLRGGIDTIYDPCEVLIWGEGNINVDSLFVDPGYWADANDPNQIAEPNDPNAVWVDGDYHLKSQAGRYDPNSESWVIDEVTSPCIDAGDPNSPVGNEPEPNGGRINMGAYGGTIEASKSSAD